MAERASRLWREDSCVSACAAVPLGLEEIRTGFLPRASPRQRCAAPQGAMLLARRRREKIESVPSPPMSLDLCGSRRCPLRRRSCRCPSCLRLRRCSPRRCLRLRPVCLDGAASRCTGQRRTRSTSQGSASVYKERMMESMYCSGLYTAKPAGAKYVDAPKRGTNLLDAYGGEMNQRAPRWTLDCARSAPFIKNRG